MTWHIIVAPLFAERKPIARLNVSGVNFYMIANIATTKIAKITERVSTRVSGRIMTMPRYYDLDKLAEMIQAKADTLINGKEAFLYVAKWLDLLPPADVAPKSEVERLEGELIVETTRRKNAVNAYHEARQKVAREIFEEIEKIAKTVGFPEALVNGMIVNHILDGLYIDSQDFAELKKKHTEEKS